MKITFVVIVDVARIFTFCSRNEITFGSEAVSYVLKKKTFLKRI